MLIGSQNIIEISNSELFESVQEYKKNGFRLVQIHCTKVDEKLELNYSFAKEYDFENLRFILMNDEEVASISTIYEPAFLYENEMHDLFGIKINNISIDYQGNLYKISENAPFGVKSKECIIEG